GVEDRSAFFITDLCYIDKQGKVSHYVGKVKGFIGKDLEGANGFGYDPIFLVEYEGKIESFATLGEDIKNKMSHRANAFNSFCAFWKAKK
ncbi:MAG: non-canonical purine NTP pyrophosphatase, partial [Bacilli bacterium]|nr:non-canonical purine NTP pyrophosphatase [Bacilli bacterium]